MSIETHRKYRFDNLEFRWTKTIGEISYWYPEIVCWSKNIEDTEPEWCYTLAYWVEDSEGWDLKFVGNRPFEADKVDQKLFWELAKIGDSIANADWKMNQIMRER